MFGFFILLADVLSLASSMFFVGRYKLGPSNSVLIRMLALGGPMFNNPNKYELHSPTYHWEMEFAFSIPMSVKRSERYKYRLCLMLHMLAFVKALVSKPATKTILAAKRQPSLPFLTVIQWRALSPCQWPPLEKRFANLQ